MSVETCCQLATAMRMRVKALAASSELPSFMEQSSHWYSAWTVASSAVRLRVLWSVLGLDQLKVSTLPDVNADVAVLPPPSLKRLLFMRAMYARIHAVRRCVHRAHRQWFVQQVGPDGWDWILARYAPPAAETLLPLGDDHLQSWYEDGWYRLYHDRVWTHCGLALLAAAGACVQPSTVDALRLDLRSHVFLDEWRQWTLPQVEAA